MKRDQRQIDKVQESIARVTRLMASPNRSPEIVRRLELRRQKYHVALKILSKTEE